MILWEKSTARGWLLAAAALAAGPLPAVPPVGDMADVSARIEYGFLTQDTRSIRVARTSLDRFGDENPWRLYYDALGAYRLALLGALKGERGVERLAAECLEQSIAASRAEPEFAESLILTAACASIALRTDPTRARTHRRRMENALNRARELEPENPRLPLVEAMAISIRPAEKPELAERLMPLLESARQAFDSAAIGLTDPEWGEAETLAMLGEIHLSRGETRAARDLIEQALIIAPEYTVALKLQHQLGVSRR